MAKTAKTYNTLRNLNKPLYFMGFSPMIWVLMILVFVIGFMIFKFFTLLFFVPVFLIGKKISLENKKGNPDSVDSWLVFLNSKRRVIDRDNILNQILNTDD